MLDQKLIAYSQSNIYPFHMPGHKRQAIAFPNPYSIDITEIDGFDNLHHAQDILLKGQQRAAELYGAKKSFYLVNGSTCGILASICAATKKGDRILVARNCHKAVYHAIYLQELKTEYLYPKITRMGIQGQITAGEVEKKLEKFPDVKAVVITSPTYDGVVSDIEKIAEIVHAHQIPLIVDEAHGAHFGFGYGFPENAVKQGADAVIVSLHKTFPCFTQTALLHLCSNRIPEENVAKYLGIFETSSPSYIFMAGIEQCIRMVKEDGESLFFEYQEKRRCFFQQVKELKYLHVMTKADLRKEEAFDFDDGKILIFPKEQWMSGRTLADLLLQEYELQMEMATDRYVVAMTSIMDTKEGFDRLSESLKAIDQKREKCLHQVKREDLLIENIYTENEVVLNIFEAEDSEQETIQLCDSCGRISAAFVYLYPPGIPIIAPGEVITQKFVRDILLCQKLHLDVEGLEEETGIKVVNCF